MYMKYIINYNVDCFILQVCSLLVILILSPIENNNRRLEYSEKKLYKKNKVKSNYSIYFKLLLLLEQKY